VEALGVSDNKWLIFRVSKISAPSPRFCVYNLETNRRINFFPEAMEYGFHQLQQALDCSKSFFSIVRKDGHRNIVAFAMNDGGLSEQFSFPIDEEEA